MFSISYFIGTNKHNIKHRFSLYSAANMRRHMSTYEYVEWDGIVCHTIYIPVLDCDVSKSMMCSRGYLISYYSFNARLKVV